jgi:anti-sigma regulatory factor (Ser/Thr protein kinase)
VTAIPDATDAADAGPVRLSLPASPRYLSAARVVAASLGAESGLSIDDLEDLRLGVNELVSILVESGHASDRVELEFETDGSSITVRGQRSGDGGGPLAVDELTTRIVEAVADSHEIDGTSFSLTKASSIRER